VSLSLTLKIEVIIKLEHISFETLCSAFDGESKAGGGASPYPLPNNFKVNCSNTPETG
jgi:hypothetical protein